MACLATAWPMLGNCMATAWRRHGDGMAEAWRLRGNCNCMSTALGVEAPTWQTKMLQHTRSHHHALIAGCLVLLGILAFRRSLPERVALAASNASKHLQLIIKNVEACI